MIKWQNNLDSLAFNAILNDTKYKYLKLIFLYIIFHDLLKDKCNNVKQNPIQNLLDATERNATGMRKTNVVHESYSTYDKTQNSNDVK